MRSRSKYYKCKKCEENLSFTIDTGQEVEITEGNNRIPILYALGCPECGFMITSRLMIINPADEKSD